MRVTLRDFERASKEGAKRMLLDGTFTNAVMKIGRDSFKEFAVYFVDCALSALTRLLPPVRRGVSLMRMRRHVLLYWRKGWFKSSILLSLSRLMKGWEIIDAGSTSWQRLRGSVESGRFLVPLFHAADVILMPELFATVTPDDESYVEILNRAMEEGRITVSLVKFGQVPEDEISRIRALGISYRQDLQLMEYDCNAVFLAASHDNVTPQMRMMLDAGLASRFVVLTRTFSDEEILFLLREFLNFQSSFRGFLLKE